MAQQAPRRPEGEGEDHAGNSNSRRDQVRQGARYAVPHGRLILDATLPHVCHWARAIPGAGGCWACGAKRIQGPASCPEKEEKLILQRLSRSLKTCGCQV